MSGTGRTAMAALALAGCDAVFGTRFEPPIDAFQHDADLTGCLRDTFQDGTHDPTKWRVDTTDMFVVAETGGQLVISMAAGASGVAALVSAKRHDVTRGQAVVEVVAPLDRNVDAFLSLVIDSEHAYTIRANTGTIAFQTVAPMAAPAVELAYDVDAMRYWRILYLMVGDDAVMNFDTSRDNLSWVNRHGETTAHVPVTSLEVQLGARTVGAARATEARFDTFQLVTAGCPLI